MVLMKGNALADDISQADLGSGDGDEDWSWGGKIRNTESGGFR